MKLATCLLLIAVGVGCGKDKAKDVASPATEAPAASTEAGQATPAADNVPLSHSVSVSADLAAACGLATARTPDPRFEYDKDELTEQDRAVLAQIATCLTSGPLAGRKVSMIGRADPRGTEEYNLGLGSRRAHTVGDYLSRNGVKSDQLAFTTRGALDATGTDEAGWREDRRVDIELQ